jgi:hypothetical protein
MLYDENITLRLEHLMLICNVSQRIDSKIDIRKYLWQEFTLTN